MVGTTAPDDLTTDRQGIAGVIACYCGLIAPAILMVLGIGLQFFIFNAPPPRPEGALGPGAWPVMALTLMAIFAALWLLGELRAARRPAPAASSATAEDDNEPYSYTKAVIGIALIIAFGFALDVFGFAVTSMVFISVWAVYGGIYKPHVILPVAIIGTVVLLWMFMGLALMPLTRGQGVFDTFSIWLLQLLQIY